MSETYYCPAVVRPMRWQDPEPEELCSNEVDNEGDLCPAHEEDDRSDELYDQYLDAKYEEHQLGTWGTTDEK